MSTFLESLQILEPIFPESRPTNSSEPLEVHIPNDEANFDQSPHISPHPHVIPQDNKIWTLTPTAHDANQASTNSSPHTRHHYEFELGRNLLYHDWKGSSEAIVYEGASTKYQTISFSRVGSHHHNGIVEHKNCVLTQGNRTLLRQNQSYMAYQSKRYQ